MEGRIDAHQHFWRYDSAQFEWIAPESVLARDYAPEHLRTELEHAGISRSIVVQARQSDDETRWLLGIASRTPWIAGVIGWADLRAEDVAAHLDALAQEKALVGLRHVVQDEPDPRFLLDPAFQHGVRAALKRGLAYDLLVRAPQLEYVPAFLDAIGAADAGMGAVVIDHGAKPAIINGEWQPWADRIAAIARDYPVWCKLSGLVTEADLAAWDEDNVLRYMAHLLECFGSDRLIYGSDWPVCLLAAPYARVKALADRLLEQLDAPSREAIMGGNAQRAYARIAAPILNKIEGEIVQ